MDSAETRRAIVVGVSDYLAPSEAAHLPFATKDAEAVADLLRSAKPGYEVALLRSSGAFDTTAPFRSNILDALRRVFEGSTADDLVLLYFAGHGHEADDDCLLLPADARISAVRETGISLRWLKGRMDECAARNKLLIVDACSADARRDPEEPGVNAIGRAFDSEVVAVLGATSAGLPAWEGGNEKHGVFTHFLLEGLKGDAQNGDHLVTVYSLYTYVVERVSKWAGDHGKTQVPTISIAGRGDLVLVDHREAKSDEGPTRVAASPWGAFRGLSFVFECHSPYPASGSKAIRHVSQQLNALLLAEFRPSDLVQFDVQGGVEVRFPGGSLTVSAPLEYPEAAGSFTALQKLVIAQRDGTYPTVYVRLSTKPDQGAYEKALPVALRLCEGVQGSGVSATVSSSGVIDMDLVKSEVEGASGRIAGFSPGERAQMRVRLPVHLSDPQQAAGVVEAEVIIDARENGFVLTLRDIERARSSTSSVLDAVLRLALRATRRPQS